MSWTSTAIATVLRHHSQYCRMRWWHHAHAGGQHLSDSQDRSGSVAKLGQSRGPEKSDPGRSGPLVVAQLVPDPVEAVPAECAGPAASQLVRDNGYQFCGDSEPTRGLAGRRRQPSTGFRRAHLPQLSGLHPASGHRPQATGLPDGGIAVRRQVASTVRRLEVEPAGAVRGEPPHLQADLAYPDQLPRWRDGREAAQIARLTQRLFGTHAASDRAAARATTRTRSSSPRASASIGGSPRSGSDVRSHAPNVHPSTDDSGNNANISSSPTTRWPPSNCHSGYKCSPSAVIVRSKRRRDALAATAWRVIPSRACTPSVRTNGPTSSSHREASGAVASTARSAKLRGSPNTASAERPASSCETTMWVSARSNSWVARDT